MRIKRAKAVTAAAWVGGVVGTMTINISVFIVKVIIAVYVLREMGVVI